MSWFIGIMLSLILIVQICIFLAVFAFVGRMRRVEPMIDLIHAWVITASPNRHSISGRPMTKQELDIFKEETEEGVEGIEAIPPKKADVPS